MSEIILRLSLMSVGIMHKEVNIYHMLMLSARIIFK